MSHPNEKIIENWFAAYMERDFDAMRTFMAEDATWHFPGRHPLSGEKKGMAEVVAFFDEMSTFKMRPHKYVTGVNDGYLVESQRVQSQDAPDTELEWCVLWTFADGKIVKGTHFSADQHKADEFFKRQLKARKS